jgi:hypothetical protein
MSEEVAGFMGGAMRFGFPGGAIAKLGVCPPALCAELRAGKDGGGILSSSSSSSEVSRESSVKVGTAGAFRCSCGAALGVVCGDVSEGALFVVSRIF